MSGRETFSVGFLLLPDFALLPLASAADALRMANWLARETLYHWEFISEDSAPAPSSCGVAVGPTVGLGSAPRHDMVIVAAGGRGVAGIGSRALLQWLRVRARGKCLLGAIGLGSFVLARAGLLDGYRCTLHWQSLPGFREEFPHIHATGEVYEIDRDRYTCAGGTATLDLMLALIAQHHGADLATRVAEDLIHERIRTSRDDQRMPLRLRLNTAHPKLLEVVSLMEGNLEEPLSCTDLAERVRLSVRQLEKLFRAHLKHPPRDYYIRLRLARARKLLKQTSMSVLEVGLATGFTSASHFSKSYREHFKHSPRLERASGAE